MKGHLGFRCRTCVKPSEPTNLRQVGTGTAASQLNATLAWDAPVFTGGGPILGYKIEQTSNESESEWTLVSEVGPTPRQINLAWCEFGKFRVSAVNRCGLGPTATFSNWTFTASGTVVMLTASATLTPPCWANYAKFWCVGAGGTAGGGLAYKTWVRQSGTPWNAFSCYIQNTPNPSVAPYLPRASVSYGDTSVTAFGADGTTPGTWLGGDGGAFGGGGGNSYAVFEPTSPYYNISYPFTGTATYTGPYTFGGNLGNYTGIGSPPAIALTEPCRRRHATDRSSLFEAVSMLGLRVTEECESEPAFGSGAVSFTISTYGGGTQRIDFTAGYGGGGIDASNPGGPGCIIARYS